MADQVRCEPCLGMGYKGRYRKRGGRKDWKIETCRSCGGSGQRPASDRQRQHKGGDNGKN